MFDCNLDILSRVSDSVVPISHSNLLFSLLLISKYGNGSNEDRERG